ncbi:DNA primase small subunit [Diplonema papillatum]|nr:DNA primase small subunit [Diplonema papillatum]
MAGMEEKMDVDEEREIDQPAADPEPEAAKKFPPVELAQLAHYYNTDYPCELMQRWLGYGSASLFRRREFVFQKTLYNSDGQAQDKPLMVRYKSYDGSEQLRDGLKKFEPDRVEIGPVYTHQPKLREKVEGRIPFEPVQRELVFDIDASDYDDVRVCCSDRRMCPDCWAFMTAGVRILDKVLRDDFGFEHLLWVFSGRRGIHCWVSDKKARKLTDNQRAALSKYIEVHLGGKTIDDAKLTIERELQGNWLHPSLKRIHAEYVQPAFDQILLNPDNQNNLSHPTIAAGIVQVYKSRVGTVAGVMQKVQDIMQRAVSHAMTPRQAWEAIRKIKTQAGQFQKSAEWVHSLVEFMYTYPRLDVKVTTKRNHLLKSPFSIHPGTGLLCVPFLLDELDTFRPFSDAPHISQLTGMRLPRLEIFERYIERMESERMDDDDDA